MVVYERPAFFQANEDIVDYLLRCWFVDGALADLIK